MIARGTLFCATVSLLSTTELASGQPLDCDHLLHSKVPFQMDKVDRSNKSDVKLQVF